LSSSDRDTSFAQSKRVSGTHIQWLTSGLIQEGQSLGEDEPTSQNSEKMLRNNDESLDVVDVHILDEKTKTLRKK